MSEAADRVNGVHWFVVKGCHETTIDGNVPTSLEVGETGFTEQGFSDRELTLVEANPSEDNTYLFLSQRGWDESGRPVKGRHDNQLAIVETDLRNGLLHIVAPHVGGLALSAADDSPQRKLVIAGHYDENVPKRNVRVHSSILPEALDQGDEVADFFTEVVGRPVRLVRANRTVIRKLPKIFRREGAVNKVAGADGFPFLITNQASLDEANAQSGFDPAEFVDLRQYRGNIELDGAVLGPWGEDFLRRVRIGRTVIHTVKPSIRCIVTNNPQDTAEGRVKGLRVLRGHDGLVPETGDEGAIFGQNGNHEYVPGARISVGDAMQVLERGDEPNFVRRAV